MKKKIISLALVFAMALALGIGGTIAWLTDKTDSVVNTFTVGDININLTEEAGSANNYTFKFVPGDTITKDPKVTVEADSEACYLFVKIEELRGNVTVGEDTYSYSDFMQDYEVIDDWAELEDGVYYMKIGATTSNTDYYILKDNQVKTQTTVTKAMADALTADTYPQLKFTAYAIQSANLADQNSDGNIDAADAWVLVSAN